MFNIDVGASFVEMILAWAIFYYVFSTLYKIPKFYLTVLLFLISLLTNILFDDYALLITSFIMYLFIPHQKNPDHFLINTILLSSLVKLLASILNNSTILTFLAKAISLRNFTGYPFITIQILIELAVAAVFLFVYRTFDLENKLAIKDSSVLGLLLGYLYVVIFFFMKSIQYYQAYSDLISGILLFILIQCIFIVILFLREIQNQKVAYSRELTRNQLKNLKMYTDQLEKDQIKLRGFKHSYKDLIANLRTVADTGNYEAMTNSLSKLEDYSDSYFDNISMQLFKDLNNVKNPYLKSLLISKLTLISQHKTNCHFECKDVVDDVSINIFDLVRLLGISIDNAIEATNDQAHGEIQIAFVKDNQQLAILINNTTDTDNSVSDMLQEGYTTKKNHSGIGMVNIQDIKLKYPNLFVQYRKNSSWFNLSILITQ